MAEIKPFKGCLYNTDKVGDYSKVVAPPYDVISENDRTSLKEKSPYNIVHLILGDKKDSDNSTENVYTRASNVLSSFVKEKVLVDDDKEALYLYRQDYTFGNESFSRYGFFTLVKIEDFNKKGILPHEKTHSGPKEDRFNLIKSVKSNLSPIFGIFPDTGNDIITGLKQLTNKLPIVDIDDGLTRHCLWRITDDEYIQSIKEKISDKKIFIADGHHRYEVSLRYRDYIKSSSDATVDQKEASDYTLMYLTSFDDEGLSIFPTHRLVKDMKGINYEEAKEKLTDKFLLEEFSSRESFIELLSANKKDPHIFGIYFGDSKYLILRLKKDVDLDLEIDNDQPLPWKKLGVNVLHIIIFENILKLNIKEGDIAYSPYADESCNVIDNNEYQAAFFLSPTKAEEIKDVAELGLRMPEKSTYFYPKLLSGLLIRRHDKNLETV